MSEENNTETLSAMHRPVETWEKAALEKLLYATLKEQRRARRWGVFFKCILVLYILTFTLLMWSHVSNFSTSDTKPHAAVIDIEDTIMPGNHTNARAIIASLHRAFHDSSTRGVILRINSPGGSPVQSAYVYQEIKRLRQKYPHIPVYAVCADTCASGAYYIAAAADKIFANEASLVGSIGVMIDGFGFVNTLQKLGVERRLLTAGANKGLLDPFSPMNDTQQKYVTSMLESVHQKFIEAVKTGRGKRLKNDPSIFSGLAWTGVQAKPLGLIDDFMSTDEVARTLLHTEKMVNYSSHPDVLSMAIHKFSATFANVFLSHLQAHLS